MYYISILERLWGSNNFCFVRTLLLLNEKPSITKIYPITLLPKFNFVTSFEYLL